MMIDMLLKVMLCQVMIDGYMVMLMGISKGVGMIKLNMVMMFGFFVFDVNVVQLVFDMFVKEVVDCLFNCIMIDGDMLMNDLFILIVLGKSMLLVIMLIDLLVYVVLCDVVMEVVQVLL